MAYLTNYSRLNEHSGMFALIKFDLVSLEKDCNQNTIYLH